MLLITPALGYFAAASLPCSFSISLTIQTPFFSSVGKVCQPLPITLRQHHMASPILKLKLETECSSPSHLSQRLIPSSELSTPQTLNGKNKKARDT